MTAAMDDAPEPALGYFEDDPVWGAVLRVKGLGDGLSKTAEIAPAALKRGETGVLVIEYSVRDVGFPVATGPDDTPGVNRLHTLQAGMVVLADRSIVAKVLDEHRRKLDEAANRKALFDGSGNPTEPLGDDEDDLSPEDKKVRDIFDGKDGDKGGRGRRRA